MLRLVAGLRYLLRSLADFAFPPRCWGCDEETDGEPVCEGCQLLLFSGEMEVCPGCGRPSREGACGLCAEPFGLTRVRALGPYQPPYLGLVHALKYSGKTRLVPLLGAALAGLAGQDTGLRSCDAVCAVPLHPARLRERGFNQSELLAAVVAAQLGKPLVSPVVRKRNTRSQATLRDAARRRRNLAGAFAARPDARLDGASVLLVDDVMTTGATLDAVGTALLAAGAAQVSGLVVAWAGGTGAGRGCRAPRRNRPGILVAPVRGVAGRDASG